MTQTNIGIMDRIADELAMGKKLSEALKAVYTKRNLGIPYKSEVLSVSVTELNMSNRTTNALLRARLKTLEDIVNYCERQKLTTIKNFGTNSGMEVLEALVDWCWDHMDKKEKGDFLIDVIERNSNNIKAELM